MTYEHEFIKFGLQPIKKFMGLHILTITISKKEWKLKSQKSVKWGKWQIISRDHSLESMDHWVPEFPFKKDGGGEGMLVGYFEKNI